MQQKSAVIHTRVKPELKLQAEAILASLGMSTSEAITLYLNQIVLNDGLPFAVRKPNKTTLRAMREVKEGKTKRFTNIQDLLKELNA